MARQLATMNWCRSKKQAKVHAWPDGAVRGWLRQLQRPTRMHRGSNLGFIKMHCQIECYNQGDAACTCASCASGAAVAVSIVLRVTITYQGVRQLWLWDEGPHTSVFEKTLMKHTSQLRKASISNMGTTRARTWLDALTRHLSKRASSYGLRDRGLHHQSKFYRFNI